jgi:hypothetical protein
MYLVLRPKEGIEPVLFTPNNIDSIAVGRFMSTKYKDKHDFTITQTDKIDSISKLLSSTKKVENIDNLRQHNTFYTVDFYVKNEKKPIDIVVVYHEIYSKVFQANDLIFNGDGLDQYINSFWPQ